MIPVFLTLLAALVLFIHGRWRYDLVALGCLLALVLVGTIPASEAFVGFGHPAVITVAAVLVVSRGLAASGVVDLLASRVEGWASSPWMLLVALTLLVTVLSAFMNNVGALALMMPVALTLAHKKELPVSMLLMPLAFGSLLGGLTTLIGTPPNIIIGAYRAEVVGEPFGLFDFSPAGVGIAVAGVLFLVLFSKRLIPRREGQTGAEALFEIRDYTFEALVPEGAVVGMPLRRWVEQLGVDILVLAIQRDGRRLLAPGGDAELREGDLVIFETAPADIAQLLEETGWQLEAVDPELAKLESDDVALVEAVVRPDSPLVRRSVRGSGLRSIYGLNVLAVSRQGARLPTRLADVVLQGGDVLMLQGSRADLPSKLEDLGCLPLAERSLQLFRQRRILVALAIFVGAIGLLLAGLQPAAVAFSTAAVAMVLVGLLRLRQVYEAVDWPILILLAAMIPIGTAFETTGGAAWVAGGLGIVAAAVPAEVAVLLVLVLTMFLSDLMNNAATAVLMAPIAVGLAGQLEVSPDPLLMAVAVGASCAFLTPIGHQSNTLVMGPGGYRFGDYWRLGLPLEAVIALVGTPLILWFWPLAG